MWAVPRQGRQVYVEGRLTTRQYEAKDGSGKRYRTEIVAGQLRLLGNRAANGKAETSDDIPFWFHTQRGSRESGPALPAKRSLEDHQNGHLLNRYRQKQFNLPKPSICLTFKGPSDDIRKGLCAQQRDRTHYGIGLGFSHRIDQNDHHRDAQ